MRLVPKEVKRVVASRLSASKTALKKNIRRGYDITIREKRVKAYERLKKSLNNTPGDLSCDADYEAKVAELADILRLHQTWIDRRNRE